MRSILFAAALAVSAGAAEADCAAEIRNVFDARSTQEKVRVHIETTLDGKIVQETNGWIQDFGHNMYEVVGRGWWSMTYGDTHYNSTDGKIWNASGQQDPDWEEKALQAREKIVATMTNTQCGESEEIDGTTYQVYRYRHEAEVPYQTKTDNVLYFDPEERFLFRAVAHNRMATGGKVVTTYTRDDSVEIPSPD